MKTILAIPTMGTVTVDFFQSCMHMALGQQLMGVVELPKADSSLVYDARNNLAQYAIDAGADYILWLDSDMSFEPDTLLKMQKAIGDKDFLTGLYFKRRPPYGPTIYKELGYKPLEDGMVEPVAEAYEDYPKDSVFEIAGCGFGCVLMKTQMAWAIWQGRGLPFSPILGFGEDISFCIKAREMGYKMYCDSSIKFGHTASITVTEDISEAWRQVNDSKD